MGSLDLADDVGGIRDRVEHVAFEAVQRLDGELDVVPRRIRGRVSYARSTTLARSAFVGGSPGEDAERLIERTAERLAARGSQAIDRPFEMLEARGAHCGIGAGAIALGVGNDGDRGRAQAVVTDRLANLFESARAFPRRSGVRRRRSPRA